MPTRDEILAAAERLRKWNDAVASNRNFGAFPAPMIKAREVSRAEEVLAQTYLAEHSSDDAPVTPEWLESIGFFPDPVPAGGVHHRILLEAIPNSEPRWLQLIPCHRKYEWTVEVIDENCKGELLRYESPISQGQVKALCFGLNCVAALGVTP